MKLIVSILGFLFFSSNFIFGQELMLLSIPRDSMNISEKAKRILEDYTKTIVFGSSTVSFTGVDKKIRKLDELDNIIWEEHGGQVSIVVGSKIRFVDRHIGVIYKLVKVEEKKCYFNYDYKFQLMGQLKESQGTFTIPIQDK